MKLYYIDRKTGERKEEIVAGDRYLKWMYGTASGNSILELIAKKKIFSSVYGRLQDTSSSKRKISRFIKELQIDMDEAERRNPEEYKNFNDFFARTLRKESRPITKDPEVLISPADGRVFAYEHIDMNKVVQVKGSTYRLMDLFQNNELAREYDSGVCMVIRLCPADYHRFHFPDGGVVNYTKKIEGNYYSVNPIALKKIAQIYCQNKREISLFQSNNFGQMVLMEVGATCVGSIVQTYKEGQSVEKGEEKGYFKFGGSTVILFLKKGAVKIDRDLIENTEKHIETKVHMGEGIGRI